LTVSDYTYILNRPDAINDRHTKELEKVIEEFPYFQSARALRLKGLYNQNSFQYNYTLKVTAAYTTERSVLFDFITSDSFTAIHKGLYEKKLAEIHDINVHDSEVVVPVTPADPSINKAEQSILISIREAEAANQKEVTFEEVIADDEPQLYAVIDQAEETEIAAGTDVADAERTPIEVSNLDFSEVIFEPKLDVETEIAEEPQIETGSEESISAGPETVETSEKHQTEPTPEEKLEIGRPLNFSRVEKHSFFEWLQLSKLQPIIREEELEIVGETQTEAETVIEEPSSEIGTFATETVESEETEDSKEAKLALIDRFIEANPKIPPVRQDAKPISVPEPPVDNAELMTETLARVYLEQKKYSKAIQAYEILILKYPEKSSFFADRISEIRNLQQNNLLQ